MTISRNALSQIRRLRSRQRLPPSTALRLGLMNERVQLSWDSSGPSPQDMVMRRGTCPVFVDAATYLHLADYELDFQSRFLLKPRRLGRNLEARGRKS